MLKSILNLEGAQGLSKNEQKFVHGGMLAAQKPSHGSCSVLCADITNSGTLCGPKHCPSVCISPGQWERI